MKTLKRKTIQIFGGIVVLILATFFVMPCFQQEGNPNGTIPPKLLSYQEFKAQAFTETYHGTPTGVYIVDGDTPVDSEARMHQLYDEYFNAYQQAYGHAAVYIVNGVDVVWDATQKLQLTYCISDAFGSRKIEVVTAMSNATTAWKAAANVNFTYLPVEDMNCSPSNANVMFDVELTGGQGYLARSFFPNTGRLNRNIMIDVSSFTTVSPLTLTGILRHELGHALGLRHEHTRPDSGTCFEDNGWRPLTPYDSSSVMHYPQCNGTGDWSLILTTQDILGIATLYGAPI